MLRTNNPSDRRTSCLVNKNISPYNVSVLHTKCRLVTEGMVTKRPRKCITGVQKEVVSFSVSLDHT